jgi:hypothetical protein
LKFGKPSARVPAVKSTRWKTTKGSHGQLCQISEARQSSPRIPVLTFVPMNCLVAIPTIIQSTTGGFRYLD